MSWETLGWIGTPHAFGARILAVCLMTIGVLLPQTAFAESEAVPAKSIYQNMPAWQLEEELQKRPLSEPIAVLVIGGIPLVVGVAALLIGTFATAACSVSDGFEPGVDQEEATFSNCASDPERRGFFVVGGIAAGAGAIIAGAGGLWLGLRLRKRGVIRNALEAKSPQLSGDHFGVGIAMGGGTPSFAVKLAF